MKDIFTYFFKIGLIGFGGPMAHIAMMDDELINKRKWATKEQFLEGLAISNLLPGPASTQLGIYMGFLKGGLTGGIIAGIAFILPAFIIISFLSYLYFKVGNLPSIEHLLYGINPLVIAMISSSLLTMSKKAVTSKSLMFIFILSTLSIILFKINLIVVLVIAGVIGAFLYSERPDKSVKLYSVTALPLLLPLTLFFLKVGSFIYGGGLVIIPFIESEVVDKLGWMSQQEFLAGIALGQVTPGPVVITAAFIGYKIAGFLGALIATIAIFLPSFLFILLATNWIQKIQRVYWFKGALKGINAAVIGSILASILSLIPDAIIDIPTLCITLIGFIAISKYKVNIFYCIIIAALSGLILSTAI